MINLEWHFGSMLWSLEMSTNPESPLGEVILKDTPICGNIFTYIPCLLKKKHCKSWNHVGWKGSVKVIQSQPPAQAISSKIRLLRACCAKFGDSPGKEVAQPPGALLQCVHLPVNINELINK